MKYALLVLPNHNRVYRSQAAGLALAELAVLNEAVLAGGLDRLEQCALGGMPCITFAGAEDLVNNHLEYFAALSFCYGMMVVEGEWLQPLGLPRPTYFDDDILTILKYSGKTNEAFTALLYNVTLWAGAFRDKFTTRLRVLDPVCGRGTTLYYGLYRGHDVDGVEIAKGDVQASAEFLSRYLKEHRYKHTFQRFRFRRPQGGSGRKFTLQGAPDKESLKADPFAVTVVNDDTVNVNNHFAKNTYHALVADLPYGVQHGGSGPGRGSIGPRELVERALPQWLKVLKPGGSLGLSWNSKAVERRELVAVLEQGGLAVLEQPPWNTFAHRVDQAVDRDLVVAVKK